jgi:hypothetical protein
MFNKVKKGEIIMPEVDTQEASRVVKVKPIYETRLSNRKAQVAAAFLNDLGRGKITLSRCYNQSPLAIARSYLGVKARESEVANLAKKILIHLGDLNKS